jgi:hypothetical protein
VPSVLPTVSRRRLLVGAAALAVLGGTVATACASSPPTKDIDALVGQLKRAQSDGELAGNAATAAPQKLAATLNTVAGQRAAHAKALSDEITRISGEAPPTTSVTSVTSSPSSPTTTSGPPPTPPTAADVVAALQQSADGASLLATQQSGYRAGLLGSIAAACTAAATVALTGSGQAS